MRADTADRRAKDAEAELREVIEENFQLLERINIPDGYSSKILKRVNSRDVRLDGLKTHDYYVLI